MVKLLSEWLGYWESFDECLFSWILDGWILNDWILKLFFLDLLRFKVLRGDELLVSTSWLFPVAGRGWLTNEVEDVEFEL